MNRPINNNNNHEDHAEDDIGGNDDPDSPNDDSDQDSDTDTDTDAVFLDSDDAFDDDNSDEEACCAPTSRKSVSEADMENTRVEHGDEEVRSRTIHPILHRSRQNRFPIIAYVNPLSASTHCRLV